MQAKGELRGVGLFFHLLMGSREGTQAQLSRAESCCQPRYLDWKVLGPKDSMFSPMQLAQA